MRRVFEEFQEIHKLNATFDIVDGKLFIFLDRQVKKKGIKNSFFFPFYSNPEFSNNKQTSKKKQDD